MDGFWPTLPDPCERFVAQVASIVREVCASDEERGCAVCDLGVRVGCTHQAVNISYEDRLDLERAKFAVTATGKIISVGFDLNEGREKQWMHDLMRGCGLFVGFDAWGMF
jgi:hypothetical protein